MTKRVLDVGQCPPDHQAMCQFLTRHFDVEITRAHGPADTISALSGGEFHLVLVNRKLDADASDGVEIIRQIKSDERIAHVPVMLVTSYAEHHDLAVEAGAERGFGKLECQNPDTVERLRPFLA